MILALLLLLASARVDLVDQVFEIPAADWRYVELNLQQQPVTVTCEFQTARNRQVRVALLRHEDLDGLDRLGEQRPDAIAAATPAGDRGSLQYVVQSPGKYVVVVDNRSRRATGVHLRVSIDFAAEAPAPDARTLSPARQAVVVAISFAVFFGIVLCAGRKLLRNVRR
jgi:hypothetical protein